MLNFSFSRSNLLGDRVKSTPLPPCPFIENSRLQSIVSIHYTILLIGLSTVWVLVLQLLLARAVSLHLMCCWALNWQQHIGTISVILFFFLHFSPLLSMCLLEILLEFKKLFSEVTLSRPCRHFGTPCQQF